VRDWPMIQAWWLQRHPHNHNPTPQNNQNTPQQDPYFKMFGKA
jgi:hypothetical protein